MRTRVYSYCGPEATRVQAQGRATGTTIKTCADLRIWLGAHPEAESEGATFVVMNDGAFRLALRRTEHVACAQGEPVLAAGEIHFVTTEETINLIEVTNQSTGYCPDPASWPAVASSLHQIGVPVPSGYTREFVFRRCIQCGELNVIKDGWFYCGVCDAALSSTWNVDRDPEED